MPASAANGATSDATITATSTTDTSTNATAKLTAIAVSVDTLVVDGDMGGPNVESYYEDALSANGVSYSYWDLSADPTLPLSMLKAHKNVIWFTGNAEEAMNYYVSTFDNSKITHIERYTGDQGIPGEKDL